MSDGILRTVNPTMNDLDVSDPRIDEGIRLFNDREFFACHDVFEDLWSELTCPERSFFQGLIQAAVALFHFEGGNRGGARRMYLSSRNFLTPFSPEFASINVSRLLEELDLCFAELCHPEVNYLTEICLNSSLIPVIRRVDSVCRSSADEITLRGTADPQ